MAKWRMGKRKKEYGRNGGAVGGNVADTEVLGKQNHVNVRVAHLCKNSFGIYFKGSQSRLRDRKAIKL